MLVPHALHESLVVEPAGLSRPLSGDQRILQRLNLDLVFFQAAQDMITTGIELPAILHAGRWKSTAMVNRYGERLLARRSGAAQLARMQQRA